MPKIIFYIDYQKDLESVFRRLVNIDPAGLEYRLKQRKDLDRSVIEVILKEKKAEKQKEIFNYFLEDYYRKNLAQMKVVRDNYQKIWEKKQKPFFELVTGVMGDLPWNFREYRFLVSSFYAKAAWGKSNNLATWWRRKTEANYHMNGYELVLTHFFETVDQIYKDKRPVSDWHLWALAEITAHILVFKVSGVRENLWPDLGKQLFKQPIEDNFKTGSYPQLANLAKEIYQLFQETENYKEYIQQAITLVKKYPEKRLLSPSR